MNFINLCTQYIHGEFMCIEYVSLVVKDRPNNFDVFLLIDRGAD
jgi:hypothetical protein